MSRKRELIYFSDRKGDRMRIKGRNSQTGKAFWAEAHVLHAGNPGFDSKHS